MSYQPKDADDAVAHFVKVTADGCWEWTGGVTSAGYALVTVGGKRVLAHRYTYERDVGPIPDDMEIDHLCRNRRCCNPVHLEAVTPSVNMARSSKGFALTGLCWAAKHDVTIASNIVVLRSGDRTCRLCRNEKNRAAKARWRNRNKERRLADDQRSG